jgi:nitroreductase
MNTPSVPLSAVDAIRQRRSVRGFKPDRVPPEVLQQVFELAQSAPSNCNTQPWQVVVLSGDSLDRLKAAWQAAAQDPAQFCPDFPYSGRYEGVYKTRQHDAAARLYQAMGIERSDAAGRAASAMRNFACFDAPHVALIYLPAGLSLREAGDCGMYAQTLMLALTAFGLASCPQTSLSFYPQAVRSVVEVPEGWQLLLGISMGYQDKSVPANQCQVGRAPLSESVRFVD